MGDSGDVCLASRFARDRTGPDRAIRSCPGPGGLIVVVGLPELHAALQRGRSGVHPGLVALAVVAGTLFDEAGRDTGNPQSPSRLRALSILALSVPAVVLSVLYFKGYEAPKHHASPGGLWAVARATVQFLEWPWGGRGSFSGRGRDSWLQASGRLGRCARMGLGDAEG